MTPARISGRIAAISIGSEYENTVFNRWILLSCRTGMEVLVFDHYLVDVPLTEGDKVRVALLAAIPVGLSVRPANHIEDGPTHKHRGTAVGLDWIPTLESFRHVATTASQRPLVIVKIPIGTVAIDPAEFKLLPQVGEEVVWEDARFDLLAID